MVTDVQSWWLIGIQLVTTEMCSDRDSCCLLILGEIICF